MMKNAVYETLPSTYGTYNTIPTLLGNDGTTTGNYLNDHPVGLNAAIGCGGQYNWDCTIVNGAITYPSGTKMYQFVQNYGFFVSPGNYNGTPVVTCTTCHNQHLMNVVKVTTGSKSGLPSGYYADHVLRPRTLQPGQRHRWLQPDGAVLPRVPRWRSQRNEQWHGWNHLLVVVKPWGESNSLPSFQFLGVRK